MGDKEPKPIDIKKVAAVSQLKERLAEFSEWTGATYQTRGDQTLIDLGSVEVVLGKMPYLVINNGHARPKIFDLDHCAVIYSMTGDYAFVRPDPHPESVHVVSVSKGIPAWGTLVVEESFEHVKHAARIVRQQSATLLRQTS